MDKKQMIALIREHIIREGLNLDDSIAYIIEMKGGKDEDGRNNTKSI